MNIDGRSNIYLNKTKGVLYMKNDIVSDAEKMIDEFFEIPNGNRPDYFEAEENYKNFLIVYITPGF